MNKVENIRIVPCDVTWEIEEQWKILCEADVSSSLNNKYLKLHTPDGGKHAPWFNVGGAGSAPVVSGYTLHEVAIAANATAAAVATALAAVVTAISGLGASASDNEVTVTADDVGQCTDADSGTTGFELVQLADGGTLELGYLDGDIEVTFEEQQNDITAHQTGTTVLTSLRQGLVNEISLTMKETDKAKYRELMLGTSGQAYTPSGGTEVFGWGTASIGQNTIIKARRLVLHPVTKNVSDKSEDMCFWKAYALPDTMTISGENPKTLGLTFKVYKDAAKPEGINQFVVGDWSQSEFVP